MSLDRTLLADSFLILRARYVGNTMAVFVMQSMGCEVAALNTVHFSKLFAAFVDKAIMFSADR